MALERNEALLRVLASGTRLSIIDLLLEYRQGLRFSEIAKGLDIYPSTLEDHLKRLVELNLIAHVDNLYIANINTDFSSWISDSLNSISEEPYFSSHRFSISDSDLRRRFFSLECEVFRDLLSIVNKAKSTFSNTIQMGFIGGKMNMTLEQGFFDLWQPEFMDVDVEVVFTRQGVEDLKKLDHPERFIDAVNPAKTHIYLVDDCDFAIGGCELGGFLFLPDLNSSVDFSQCLCFETPEGIQWLKDLFNYLKSQAHEFNIVDLEKEVGTS